MGKLESLRYEASFLSANVSSATGIATSEKVGDLVNRVFEHEQINELLMYNFPFELYFDAIPTKYGAGLYCVYAGRQEGKVEMFAVKTFDHCSKYIAPEIENVSAEKFQEIIDADAKTILNCLYRGLDEAIREIERTRNDRAITGEIDLGRR